MRSINFRSFLKAVLVAGLAAASTAFGAGELYGKIQGYVIDVKAGAPIPDATLTLTSSKLLQPETATSSVEGSFVFNRLPPGDDYVLEARLPGKAEPIVLKYIIVRLSKTTPVDVLVGALTEE